MRLHDLSNKEMAELETGTIVYSPLTGSHFWLTRAEDSTHIIWTDMRGDPCELPPDTEFYPERVL